MDDESRWKITDAEVPFKCVVLWWLKQAPLILLLSLVVVLVNGAVVSQFAKYQFAEAMKMAKAEVESLLKGDAPSGSKPMNSWNHK